MDSQQPFTSPDFITAQPNTPETISAPPSAPPRNKFFFGRFGLRAGYGMAIFIIVWFIFAQFIGGFAALGVSGQFKSVMQQQMKAASETQAWKQSHPRQKMPSSARPKIKVDFYPSLAAVDDAVAFFAMLGLAWLLARGERRRLRWYGLGTNRFSDFLPGAFWGLAALSLLVFILKSLHLLYFDSRLLTGSTLVVYAIKWLIAFLFVGFAEEYLLRGYLQFTLSRGVYGLAEKISPSNPRGAAFWIAGVILSIAFACLHLGNGGENTIGILQVFLVGIVFCYVLWRTGSLWWAVGFHMAWDWAQSFLYGVPDSGNISIGRLFQTHYAGNAMFSGGADGPEGSIYCSAIMLLVLVIVRFTTKPGVQPPLEQLPRAAIFGSDSQTARS